MWFIPILDDNSDDAIPLMKVCVCFFFFFKFQPKFQDK